MKPEAREKLAGMLSYVEAIPMDVLQAGVPWNWETFPQYMSAIGQRLGVNVGTFVGHSAVRLYAMGEDCSERDATDAELEIMRRLVRESLDSSKRGSPGGGASTWRTSRRRRSRGFAQSRSATLAASSTASR